jgi:hypothetical protein
VLRDFRRLGRRRARLERNPRVPAAGEKDEATRSVTNDMMEVWNRAALHRGGESPRSGDSALAALLLAHGYAMNGGVAHAVECLGSDELRAACEGYAFFGLADIARLLVDAVQAPCGDLSDEGSVALGQAYARLVPDDGALTSRFEKHFAAHPDLYAPLTGR